MSSDNYFGQGRASTSADALADTGGAMKDSEQAFVHEPIAQVLTVLVADDDPFVLELNGAKLRANEYRVRVAASGDDALPLLQCGRIDALVTDICMPGMLDGWSLAEQARLVNPHIAVVYTSSRRPDRARQVHGSLYVQKPYRADAIITAIRQLTLR